jgi:3' terminal RNA ribose 2'-O-methyltransferase Hen1
MLLTITTTRRPATDLGYLLHKHPDRVQTFPLSFGSAQVYYPEATDDRTTVALALDVDPVGLVRGGGFDPRFTLGRYVSDRPYTATSFLSVAIAQVFGSALNGTCKTHPQLAATPIPLSATVEMLPAAGGPEFVKRIFEPLGYRVECVSHPLDEHFPEWGISRYVTVTLAGTVTLAELLAHLYVLVPVFDGQKHYFVGEAELEKLLAKGSGWLAGHPERELIARRYLRHRPSLYREALTRLDEGKADELPDADGPDAPAPEPGLEAPLRLNDVRHEAVAGWVAEGGTQTVLDLGCGEGRLMRSLLKNPQFTKVVGADVSVAALQIAARRLRLEALPPAERDRVQLIHGALTYRDARFAGFVAAAVVVVIDHHAPQRLGALERVVFEFARPGKVVVTTPNRDYNATWPSLPAGEFRHADHRFEWGRAEFAAWAERVAREHGYAVEYRPVGPEDATLGPPTQAAVFTRSA